MYNFILTDTLLWYHLYWITFLCYCSDTLYLPAIMNQSYYGDYLVFQYIHCYTHTIVYSIFRHIYMIGQVCNHSATILCFLPMLFSTILSPYYQRKNNNFEYKQLIIPYILVFISSSLHVNHRFTSFRCERMGIVVIYIFFFYVNTDLSQVLIWNIHNL